VRQKKKRVWIKLSELGTRPGVSQQDEGRGGELEEIETRMNHSTKGETLGKRKKSNGISTGVFSLGAKKNLGTKKKGQGKIVKCPY